MTDGCVHLLYNTQLETESTYMMGCTPDIGNRHSVCTLWLEIPSAYSTATVRQLLSGQPVRVRKRQAVRPVHYLQSHTCRFTLLQLARRVAVPGQPSSLRPYWCCNWQLNPWRRINPPPPTAVARDCIQRNTWCMGPCNGVAIVCNFTLCQLKAKRRLQHIYPRHWAPYARVDLNPPWQSRL
jgi:hypothetical protein